MDNFRNFEFPYTPDSAFSKKVAYFSSEFAIDQSLKIYSGGLGFLAGSHLRSAYELKQQHIGIGILWKYGYYDQGRSKDASMAVNMVEKQYPFLVDTGIKFEITINFHPVRVKAFYLPSEVFNTAPLFLLSTDLPENDYLARTICHNLYDANTEAKIAQCMLLGIGGAKLLEAINYNAEVYHLNEAHSLPAAFYLYSKWGNLEAVRQKVVFTTHTPDPGGNEIHNIHLLKKMNYFSGLELDTIREITHLDGNSFNHTLAGLRLARIANGVSKLHGEVARQMWGGYDFNCPITHVTNAQNKLYWADQKLDKAVQNKDNKALIARKTELKRRLFKTVADQTGKLFDANVLTIVWARRFAAYKRADLITEDMDQFNQMIKDSDRPIQLIWAGKPYPKDHNAIAIFNRLITLSKKYPNVAVLTGYELGLSAELKKGSDVWLNTPRVTREASGTSGMTAAMNASVNLSTNDGWIPEFAKSRHNSFIVPEVARGSSHEIQDDHDRGHFYSLIDEIKTNYYDKPKNWWKIVKNSMLEVVPFFDSARMATEYYEKMYPENAAEQVQIEEAGNEGVSAAG